MVNQAFDITEYIHNNRKYDNVEPKKVSVIDDFHRVLEKVKGYLDSLYDDNSSKYTDDEKVERQKVEHKAILGDLEAKEILQADIKFFLHNNNLQGVKYPNFYKSLEHAICEEIYGFGAFYKWNSFPNSPSAKIMGKEIWFKINGKFEKQKEELRSEEQIYEMIRALEMSHRGLKINESNPRAELEMSDRTRINLSIPPACLFPTIVFRRFTVTDFSFEEQAKRKTIAKEDIKFFKHISNLHLNTIIAGHVESGKSTFLKTIYGARDPKSVAFLIETTRESYLKLDFPDRLVHDVYTVDGDVESAIRSAMRTDHSFLIFQEVRGYEAEGAIKSTERGTRGLLMSYHITNPLRTPEQLARHILDVHPNRKLENEVRRIAENLHLGIIMKNIGGSRKIVQSIYEICYDFKKDKAWINYLLKYNSKNDDWEYNGDISEGLKQTMREYDEDEAELFINHLEQQSKLKPITGSKIQEIAI